jgi:hypothetical protein
LGNGGRGRPTTLPAAIPPEAVGGAPQAVVGAQGGWRWRMRRRQSCANANEGCSSFHHLNLVPSQAQGAHGRVLCAATATATALSGVAPRPATHTSPRHTHTHTRARTHDLPPTHTHLLGTASRQWHPQGSSTRTCTECTRRRSSCKSLQCGAGAEGVSIQ